MKRVFLLATIVSLSVAGVWLARIAEPQPAMAQNSSGTPAVVILACSGNPLQTQTNYTVITVDSSSNSPSIGTGGSCAASRRGWALSGPSSRHGSSLALRRLVGRTKGGRII
jgi:hypothetical protein